MSLNPSVQEVRMKKKRKWPYLLALIIILLAILFGGFFYYKREINIPNSSNTEVKLFVISQGEGSGDIATRLENEKLLRNRLIFIAYLNYKQIGDKLQAGEYQIPQNLTIPELASLLSTGKIASSRITIPEGWTIDQIDKKFSDTTNNNPGDFKNAAIYSEKYSKYEFLNDLKDGDSLEGFLFPDTYQLSVDPDADDLIGKMLENFDKKYTSDLRLKTKKAGLTTYELVTLASIVEREVSKAEDRKKVASVFLNRLNIDMPLESCATIQYILKSNKTIFTYEETRTESPYNTYTNTGLPPAPIGNPSIDSIKAVLDPENTDYLYFLSAAGVTYFSKTLDEHNALKAKYLQ